MVQGAQGRRHLDVEPRTKTRCVLWGSSLGLSKPQFFLASKCGGE